MKKPAWLILGIICVVAGLALGLTNALTQKAIAEQNAADAARARQSVMTEADSFEALDVPAQTEIDGVAILSCYDAFSGTELRGKVVKAAVKGYGGTIEVTVGIAADGSITGINCGGGDFAETAGLGAKVRESSFTQQFIDMMVPVAVKKDGGEVDAITAATISSRAVCKAVSAAGEYAAGLGG